MTLTPYCSPEQGENFFCLLRFARISDTDNSLSLQKNQDAIIHSLNSLSHPLPLSLRPLIPLIYTRLLDTRLDRQLHPQTKTLLRQQTMRLIDVEMINRQWLEETFALLGKESIPVILLKGTAFSRNLYPIHAPRVGVDLDLLVTGDTFETVCELLGNTMKPVVQSHDRIATHNTLFERVFQPKKGGMPTVEIHRALTNPYIFNIDEQTLWKQSRKHPAYNSELIRILSPEDTLLHLAIHAFRDLNFCTHNLLDTHEVWCQWNPEPDVLQETAGQWGAAKVLYYMLQNTRTIMNTPIPEALLASLQPNRFHDRINKKILRPATGEARSNQHFPYRLTQLISQITFSDHPSRALKFQKDYLQTRIKDWLMTRRGSKP